ncbi:hypothetical protein GV828_01955 [Flavobacterium sp. NST-5]|uniref:FAS1 domain-containing protein n=1 Tax=Flavobacterium ichthyis TaxID=2698827 RepID=A0ABW9ZAY0_9FLAO|nr:fasciclin domain-containing protein [Flavobacterium ichthyis]NBL63958.1 hypothetical protein [Flavobacterium ichthyis]
MTRTKTLAIALFATAVSFSGFAQKTKIQIAGPKMDASKNVVENLAATPELSTISKVFQVCGYNSILSENSNFTILAPSDNVIVDKDAFFDPKNIENTRNFGAYHIIYGKYTIADFANLVSTAKDRKATVKTADGKQIIVTFEKRDMFITDEKGQKSKITFSDVIVNNGVIHGIDKPLQF